MKRNKFSLSNYKLLTGDMGELLPIGLTEVLPGDTVQHATSALIRVSPLIAPVMHPVRVRIHHWFVPHRLVWDDFEKFITGGPDGNDASELPLITFGGGSGAAIGSLADYLGVPTGVNNIAVSALPFRGYAKIWNEFYADQDLQTQLTIDTTSGADTTTNTTLQKVTWEKDYFTTSRPWTQKGTEVTLPLGTSASVYGPSGTGATTRGILQKYDNTAPAVGALNTAAAIGNGADFSAAGGSSAKFATKEWYAANPTYTPPYADLTDASAATILQLREAFALQRYQEARARYGSRYTEYLRYLGIKSSDSRLSRPEYLGGGKQTIQFSEVLQTGLDSTDAGLATMGGHGIGALRSNRYRRFFEEHGYVFSFITILPKTMYAQGLAKHWFRSTKEDFFQKELQFIGQAEVLNKEVYAAHSSPTGVFGYQDRYDEYRRQESTIAGEFRDTLDHWHMARIFTGDPTLNAAFVEANPTKRIHAVSTNDVLWIMANHSIQARRMVAKNG